MAASTGSSQASLMRRGGGHDLPLRDLVDGTLVVNPQHVPVVTLVVLADFIIARRLGSAISEGARRWWLWAGLAINLGPLAFFKYSGFLVQIIATLLHPLGSRVSVPGSPVFPIIGLSYFSFAGMSYLLDIY